MSNLNSYGVTKFNPHVDNCTTFPQKESERWRIHNLTTNIFNYEDLCAIDPKQRREGRCSCGSFLNKWQYSCNHCFKKN